MALLDRERRSATCVADGLRELLRLGHESLERLGPEHPGVAYRFMFYLARQLRRSAGVLAEDQVS